MQGKESPRSSDFKYLGDLHQTEVVYRLVNHECVSDSQGNITPTDTKAAALASQTGQILESE